MKNILEKVQNNYMMIIFVISAAAFFVSLYYSNILDLTPCVLCWYQRILFYPIFILSSVSIAFKEKLSPKFILALAIPGLILAIYHYGIQKFGISEGFVPCVAGVPCNQIDLEYFGFITIPFMSLIGFLLVTIVSIIKVRKIS